MKHKYQITLGWMFPQIMSTYGDRGNIIVLQRRCEWRGIEVETLRITEHTSEKQIGSIDLLFGGGAQDREQEVAMEHLKSKKKPIKSLIDNDIPALFVCGSPQLMGNYFEPAKGKQIEGLGIFDIHSKSPEPDEERLIGNLVAEIIVENLKSKPYIVDPSPLLVGFENHGGRTYIGNNAKPLAKVIKGNGNNGKDGTEGVVYRNALGTYLHGPLLPKNPGLADWLITKALEVKYKKKINLEPLDDTIEEKAKTAIARRLGVQV